jgi:hypothetical protein
MNPGLKQNAEFIQGLQALLLSDNTVDNAALRKIGIDTTVKSQQFGNVKITNDFWNGLSVSLVDNQRDLDGNLISSNKKLIGRVKNLFENGTKRISVSELKDMNIWNPAKEIPIGNIMLKNYSDFLFSYDYYEIKIIDEKKNIDGLWKDSVISTTTVLDVLHKFDIATSRLLKMKELDLNKDLECHFRQHFMTVKKGGRSNEGDIDLIIGTNHNYGIELKLAKELTKANISQKAIGQIELYTRQFKGNFMLIIAGSEMDKNDKFVSEVVRKARNSNCAYYYLEGQ